MALGAGPRQAEGARPARSAVTRRAFLVATSGLVVAACGKRTGAATPPDAVTFERLTSSRPFTVAHRGGGRDWPEMTAYAYQQASHVPGLRALEMSVCLSRDGVLVLSHDPSTARVTGVDRLIADTDWADLAPLLVTSRFTADRSQPPRPLSRLDQVAPDYLARYVLFVEPKVPAAEAPLLAWLTAADQPERVVWKTYITSPLLAKAKAKGFATWGYVLNEPSHIGDNLERLAASATVDLLGAPRDQNDAFVSAVVTAADRNGKQTMMWPIETVADRDRAMRLGCQGLMTSDVLGLPPAA